MRRSYLSSTMVRKDAHPVIQSAELTKPLTSFRIGVLHYQTRRTNPFVRVCPMGDQGNLIRPRWRPPSPFLPRIRGDPTHPNGAHRPSSRRRGHPFIVPRAVARGEGDVDGAEGWDWRYTRTEGQDCRTGRDTRASEVASRFVVSIFPALRIRRQRYLGYVGVTLSRGDA